MRAINLTACVLVWLSAASWLAAADEKPVAEKSSPAKKQAADEAPAAEKKPADKPAAKKPAAKKPAERKPADKKPADKKPADKKPAEPVATVSFTKDVAPIFVQHCLACHGPTDPKSQYQMHTFTALLRPGETTLNPVKPNDLEDSEIYRLMASDDPNERMPKEADPLPAEQIELVRRWIAEGARFDGADPGATLASLAPRRQHPQPPESYRVSVPVTALALSPDGQEVAVGGYHEITIWSTNGELLRRVSDVEQRVYALAYSPDGKLLAAAGGTPGQSGEFALYDPQKAKLVRSLGTTSDTGFAVTFDAEGRRVAGGAADRSIRVFDVAKGDELLLIEDHADWVMGLAFSPDGKLLASACRDKTSKAFDLATGEAVATYPGHGDTVLDVAFSADSKQVYSAGADRRIHLWNLSDGKQAASITGFGGDVFALQIHDGQLYSCSADKTARLHNLADRKEVRKFSGHADYVYTLAFDPANKRLVTGGFDGEIRIWNAEDGTLVGSFFAAPGLPAATASK